MSQFILVRGRIENLLYFRRTHSFSFRYVMVTHVFQYLIPPLGRSDK